MTEELSVKKEYRKQGVATKLLVKLLQTAKEKYDITCINGETYNGKNGMPFSWYERIGFEKVEDLFPITGKTDTLLKNLKGDERTKKERTP